MFFRDGISLVSITYSKNAYGDVTETETLTEVFADKQSIRQSEFYQANAQGLKPELTFTIRTCDYNNQAKLKYNSKYYVIIRTYEKGDFLELVCQGIVGQETR